MTQTPPGESPSGEIATGESPTGDAANWSAGEPDESYGARSFSPPAGRTWDPGPAPVYETPDFQPLTQAPPSAFPPPLGLQVVPARPTNGLAVASLVFGILGWFLLPVLAPLLAIIFGHMARGQIRNAGEGGGGMAVAGLVLGYLALAFALIGLLIAVVIVVIAASAASAAGG